MCRKVPKVLRHDEAAFYTRRWTTSDSSLYRAIRWVKDLFKGVGSGCCLGEKPHGLRCNEVGSPSSLEVFHVVVVD